MATTRGYASRTQENIKKKSKGKKEPGASYKLYEMHDWAAE